MSLAGRLLAPPRLVAGLRLLALALALLQCWARRFTMSPDGLSYLDLADAWLRRDAAALNAYWSPLYSWLLGGALALARPAPAWESTVVHLLGWLVFAAALAAFELFRHQLETDGAGAGLPPAAWTALLYSAFLFAGLRLVSVWEVTPDLLLMAILLLAAALLLRLRRGGAGPGLYALWGLLLGLAYLTKVAALPVAALMLAMLLPRAIRCRRARRGLLIAVLCGLTITAPFAAALSWSKGKLTVGDSGRLNYAWYVNRVTGCGQHWQGGEPRHGTPRHPTRRLLERPAVHEYATPVAGTCPIWTDPSYWHEGLTPAFDLRQQLAAIADNLAIILAAFAPEQAGLLLGTVWLFALTPRRQRRRGLARRWPLLLLALAPMAMYMLVHVETRFLGAAVVFLWAALFADLRPAAARRRLVAPLAAAMVLWTLAAVAWDSARILVKNRDALLPGTAAHQDWRVARELHRAGIAPGDGVAVVGYSLDAYWARLAGARIIADVYARADVPAYADNARLFWSAPGLRARALTALESTGAVAVVARGVPPGVDARGWLRLPETDTWIYLFERPQAMCAASPRSTPTSSFRTGRLRSRLRAWRTSGRR